MKGRVIDIQTIQGAEDIVKSFNKNEFEEWETGVRNGVENHDWTDLIAHPKLKITKMKNIAPGVPIELQNAVIRAWNMEYLGGGYKVLLEAIDRAQALSIESNCAKIIPVIQSSGMGKSKTVDKIATERILFPLCIREYVGENSFAYPPTDSAVYEYLLRAPSVVDQIDSKAYLRSFLCALFTAARLQAEQFFSASAKVSYACMAKTFYDFFGDTLQRNDFYEEVTVNARGLNGRFTSAWKSFRMLVNSLKECCSDWPVEFCPFLMSMDEVHVLYTQRISDAGSVHSLYSHLTSVLSEATPPDFCALFLTTEIRLPDVAPPTEVPFSVHTRNDDRLIPAFTELPFDVHVHADPLLPGQATLNSVGSLEFTAKFGRPLFYASFLSRKAYSNEGDIFVTMMCNVRQKLCGRRWPPESRAVLDASSIAVLSARLRLDLSPAAPEAKQYEAELVRHHLRILYSVQYQDVMVTGSSPEPLLAEASAEIMHSTIGELRYPIAYMDTWRLLGDFVDLGLAVQGSIGQLIGRALSISAMDRAIDALPNVCELKYQTPITVPSYYKAFLTDEAWETLRLSTPSNCARLNKKSATTTFEDVFADAYFHFSHYGKAKNSTPMRDISAWANWLRGTAVVNPFDEQEELGDRVAPIYFSSLGTVSPKTMSANLDQDMTRQTANFHNIGVQSVDDLIFTHGNQLPYIAAVHWYALELDESMTVTTPSTHDLPHPENNEEAPRYEIDFRGLGAYRIIDEVKVTIRRMLDSKNALFNQHSRQYAVPLLRQMLPVLTTDPAATAWFGGIKSAEACSSKRKGKGVKD